MKLGKLPENVLKRSVLRQIRKKREEVLYGAGIGADCAIFSPAGDSITAVCMREGVVIAGKEASPGLETHRVEKILPEGGILPGKEILPEKETSPGEEILSEKETSSGKEILQEKENPPGSREVPVTIGALIQKCANNLAAGGARPVALLITLLLPEEVQESHIRELMAEAEQKCAELGMEIAGGQTRITSAVHAAVAVVTGYGTAPGENHCMPGAAPGQDILLSKWIGLEGTALAAKRSRTRLLKRYPAFLVEEAQDFERYLSVLPEAEIGVRNGVCAMHDASEGGILGALWELAEGAGVGLRIDMRKLPLRQETVEVCECCGLNPYELLSGGCLIMTAQDGPGLLAALKEEGIPASIIGRVTEGNDRLLINGDEIRYLDRPKNDAVYNGMEPIMSDA
ncbi:MAG: hydrogenase maturation factor [Lachnospiraceae bacterium]|nr:hydrogenase maturation factor [Lachnospiraceae bacterium]